MILQPPDRDNKYVIFALTFMVSNRLQTIGDSFFSEVSTKQWFVLVVLGIMKGYSPTLNELSEAVGSSHQNVKQLILKLEQKGYVELSKDKTDKRLLRISSTPKSVEFSKEYEEKSGAFIEKLFSNISEADLETTKNVMSTMRDLLEGMEKDYVRE
jgi:DNA-binding MarR family transcriptional regulator